MPSHRTPSPLPVPVGSFGHRIARLLTALLFGGAIGAALPGPAGCTPPGEDQPLPEEVDAGVIPDGADAPTDLASPPPQPDLSGPRCSGKPAAVPGTTTHMMMSRGQQRTYFLIVPKGYDPVKPSALVLAFHGLSDKAADFMKYIEIEREADQKNVIAIVPQGLGFVPGWNAGNCCGEAQLFKIDDVGFARDLVDAARRDFCIDDQRVFAMGFSNGGMLSHRLACEQAGTFAAIGPVSGSQMVTECKPERPISILHMHGNADPIVGYNGGGSGTFPSVPMMMTDWAQRDRCTGMAQETYKNGAVSCSGHKSCADKTEVTLCTIDQGKHAWPGAADGTKDIRATAELLDFFARHGR